MAVAAAGFLEVKYTTYANQISTYMNTEKEQYMKFLKKKTYESVAQNIYSKYLLRLSYTFIQVRAQSNSYLVQYTKYAYFSWKDVSSFKICEWYLMPD